MTYRFFSALISYIEDRKRPLWMGIAISLAMFTVALVQSMVGWLCNIFIAM